MNHDPFRGTTERYRLRRAVLGEDGRQRMEPMPDHPALFHTWREAQAAARDAGGRRAAILVQSVLVDGGGAVVFPADDAPQRSVGMWRRQPWAGRSIHPPRTPKAAKPPAPVTKPRAKRARG